MTEFRINDDSRDVDIRIESDGDQNVLFIDAGTSKIGIGKNTPAVSLDVVGQISCDSMILSPDTVSPDAVEGTLYFNTSDNKFKVYTGTEWQSVALE